MPTLKELGDVVAKRSPSLTKAQVDRTFELLVEEMAQALVRGDTVRFGSIGTFTPKTKPPTTGRNPRTGESLAIGERQQVRFKMSSVLNTRLNPPQVAAAKRKRA